MRCNSSAVIGVKCKQIPDIINMLILEACQRSDNQDVMLHVHVLLRIAAKDARIADLPELSMADPGFLKDGANPTWGAYLLLPPANEVCEGYVFTGGRCTPPGKHIPLASRQPPPPQAGRPPSRQTPPPLPPGQTPLPGRQTPPLGQTPLPPGRHPPEMATAADSTHLAGMHSCLP